MTNQELVNMLEQFPSDAIVKISMLGYVGRDVRTIELSKDEDGKDDGGMILELLDDLHNW